ncbi:MAG: hypothetical protein AAB367_02705 [Patescibacteria group bacterium]
MKGITEAKAPFHGALKQVGKEKDGETVGIAYFEMQALHLIGNALRVAALLVLVVCVLFAQQPFWWLPEYEALDGIRGWQMFGWVNGILAIVIFGIYTAFSIARSGITVGQPGTEIHLTKYDKIVKTIRPGEWAIVLDPRIRPYAAVSTKPFVLEMDPVEGMTTDSISFTYPGTLVLRVVDSRRLLAAGGFATFLAQVGKRYASAVQDMIQGVRSNGFTRFNITPAGLPAAASDTESITTRLAQLDSSALSVELLERLSDIGELDISGFDLSEGPNPDRNRVLGSLQPLAADYGIEIVDHIPLGSLAGSELISTLALPLVSSLVRLIQATETLQSIRRDEIEEEISAAVAGKKLAVLEVVRIIKELEAITATLSNDANMTSIVEAKCRAMENIAAGHIANMVATIDALLAEVRAQGVDTAGLERYIRELEAVYDAVEENLDQYVPEIPDVWVTSPTEDAIFPSFDVLEGILKRSGTIAALQVLRPDAAKLAAVAEASTSRLEEISKRADGIKVDDNLTALAGELAKISGDTGISTKGFSPDEVMQRVAQIAERAGVEAGNAPTAAAA